MYNLNSQLISKSDIAHCLFTRAQKWKGWSKSELDFLTPIDSGHIVVIIQNQYSNSSGKIENEAAVNRPVLGSRSIPIAPEAPIDRIATGDSGKTRPESELELIVNR